MDAVVSWYPWSTSVDTALPNAVVLHPSILHPSVLRISRQKVEASTRRQNGLSAVSEHPIETSWAESGILFYEPAVFRGFYLAVSSQIMWRLR